MKLLLNSPIWYILLCILLAGLGAYLLYRKDKNLSELSVIWKRILGVFRFLSLFFLAFLLLEPLLEYSKKKVEKPIVVLAYDNSESVLMSADSTQLKSELKSGFESLKNQLSSSYEVLEYSFGEKVSINSDFSFNDKETNISEFFKDVNNRYYNRNLSGIVIATDGIFNSGNSPLNGIKNLKNIPVFTVALGDTSPRRDAFIDQVSHNKLVYNGNKFPVMVAVKAELLAGKSAIVKIIKNGKVVGQKSINYSSDNSLVQVSFELEAAGKGVQKYLVDVSPLESEFSKSNNRKSFYVEVIDSKQKIALVFNSPHPDVNVLKTALLSNENTEVVSISKDDLKGPLNEFSFVIFHNLPVVEKDVKLINSIESAKLLVLGNQINVELFNKLGAGVAMKKVNGSTEAQVYVSKEFSLFTMSKGLKQILPIYSPVQVPFTSFYEVSNSTEVVLFQKIGPAQTTYPFIAINRKDEFKTGFILGEGIWRWKMQEYSQNGSSEFFDELITQTAQYLITKEDKSKFRVFAETEFKENQKVRFEAEVYNGSYELVNSKDVNLTITNEKEDVFSYTFSKLGDMYQLDAGNLSPGNYSYVASTLVDGKKKTKSGFFTILELQKEIANLVANHQLLFNLSDISGGEMLGLEEMDRIPKLLESRGQNADLIYIEKEVDDLINLRPLFLIVLLLLGVEWFVRKRNGAY